VTETSQIAQIAPIPPDWRHLVESFCTLGASDEQLAQLFSVSPETLAGWMAEIPDFADAVRCGRNLANADVANSLYQLAVGYSHRVERVLTGRDGPMTVSFLKRHPPSHVACKTWLENRRPQDWGRAAIKRKLQAWDDARDAAARQPSFLSDAALAALVVAHKEAGGRLDAEPAVDPVGAREWPRVDEPYGEAMGVCRTVVERVAAQGILGWFAVLPDAPCAGFRPPASSARLSLLEAGHRISPFLRHPERSRPEGGAVEGPLLVDATTE
jgi:hypothetical protein